MSMDDSRFLVVTSSVINQLENLSRKVLQDSSQVEWISASNAVSIVSFPPVSVNTTDRELESTSEGSCLHRPDMLIVAAVDKARTYTLYHQARLNCQISWPIRLLHWQNGFELNFLRMTQSDWSRILAIKSGLFVSSTSTESSVRRLLVRKVIASWLMCEVRCTPVAPGPLYSRGMCLSYELVKSEFLFNRIQRSVAWISSHWSQPSSPRQAAESNPVLIPTTP